MADDRESVLLARLSEDYEYISQHEFVNQYEDFVQRLMTVLSELPDIPLHSFVPNDTTADNLIDERHYMDDILVSFLEGERTSFPRQTVMNRWSSLILHANTIEENLSKILRYWEKGLVLLSKVTNHMSPSETHATASLTNFAADLDRYDNNNNNASIGSNIGCQIYRVTCILLCCQAFHKLRTFDYKESSSNKPRWQRYQSLLFETIRQYDQFHKQWGDHQPMMNFSLSIWIYHVVPSTSYWNSTLWNLYFPWPQMNISSDRRRIWRWRMAYEAITIAISGRLVMQVITIQGYCSGRLLRSLVASIMDHVVGGNLEFICEHYWRSYTVRELKSTLQSYENALTTESGPTSTMAILYFTLLAGDDADNDELSDMLCGMSSMWSDTDVAMILSVGWENRPCMWSTEYIWRLFFPSTNHLLTVDLSNARDDVDLMRRHETTSSYGVPMLHQLILLCTSRSIKKPSTDNSPDSPLGTFQLLFNTMVTPMDATKVERRQNVTTVVESFRIAKLLLDVYQPSCQVDTVQKLLLQCPYPGLRPKVVDLLRTFVYWNDTPGETKIWTFIDETFFVSFEDRLHSATTTCNVSALADDSEVYMATLGLLKIWVKMKRSLPVNIKLTRLAARLEYIHTGLLMIMVDVDNAQRTSESSLESPKVQHFQLNLLENSIKECIYDIIIAESIS